MSKSRVSIIVILIAIFTALTLMVMNEKEKMVDFNYTQYIKVNNKQPLYTYQDNKFSESGSVTPDSIIELDKEDSRVINKMKLKDSDLYVDIKDVTSAKKPQESLHYQNYIPFNISVNADKVNLYNNKNQLALELENQKPLPVLIKEKDKYYVEFNDNLYHVNTNEVKTTKTKSKDKVALAKEVPVFMYHYFYSKANNETAENSNYIEVNDFEKQLNYLSTNKVFTMNMNDLELFLDKKINIPVKSALLSIDDGHSSLQKYVFPLLEKYKVNATAFIISKKVVDIEKFKNPYISLESHTHDMHKGGCEGGRGGYMRCVSLKEGVADLKKSTKVLGGTTSLAYPYGDITPSAVQIVKDAGYHLAFTIEYGEVKPGMDKLLLPRVRMSTETSLQSFIDAIEN